MTSAAHLTDPKAFQREELCSAMSPIFHFLDDLDRLHDRHQQSRYCKRAAEQAVEYHAPTDFRPDPRKDRHERSSAKLQLPYVQICESALEMPTSQALVVDLISLVLGLRRLLSWCPA